MVGSTANRRGQSAISSPLRPAHQWNLPPRALLAVAHGQEVEVAGLFPRLRQRVRSGALGPRDPHLPQVLEFAMWGTRIA